MMLSARNAIHKSPQIGLKLSGYDRYIIGEWILKLYGKINFMESGGRV